jgi:hypothetical protein
VADDQVVGGVVEDTTQLTGDARAEELSCAACPRSRIGVPKRIHSRDVSHRLGGAPMLYLMFKAHA